MAANKLQNLVPIDHPFPSLDLFLDFGHSPFPVLCADRPPFRVLNLPSQPRQCMPTLVSFPGSHAFLETSSGQPGPRQLYNHMTSVWEEPTVHERERLLGLEVDDTAAGHHVTLLGRQRLLGQAIM